MYLVNNALDFPDYSMKIITLWYNDILDTHKTINMERYNKDLEVVF